MLTDNLNNSFKWNRSPSSGNDDIVYKQQFIHSAGSIFIMVKYPHLRKIDTFIDVIISSNLMDECLKIAIDVLSVDEDCIDFLTNSDIIFDPENKIKIIDETNNKVIFK